VWTITMRQAGLHMERGAQSALRGPDRHAVAEAGQTWLAGRYAWRGTLGKRTGSKPTANTQANTGKPMRRKGNFVRLLMKRGIRSCRCPLTHHRHGKEIAMTVAELVAYLQTQPQNMQVAYEYFSELVLLEARDIKHVEACEARPDGWIQRKRPDMPTRHYLVFPGN